MNCETRSFSTEEKNARGATARSPSMSLSRLIRRGSLNGEIFKHFSGLGLKNVEPILGAVDDPKLPAGAVDLVLMVDSYHEFDHPREMMLAIMSALKPGGRVALVEYRAEDDHVNIKRLHRMTEAQAIREMTAVGLEHVETLGVLPTQHLMIFRKPPAEFLN